MGKHTPGPWEAKTGRTGWGGPLPPIVHAGHAQIAVVECGEKLYTPDGDDDPEAMANRDDANARLMAVSPDLLEACKAFVAAFHDHPDRDEVSLSMARTAIAKATGEAE